MPFSNPIIPGFHPDPSICRVGGDYWLVTSSFEYFPGVPVFHSRDLVNWKLAGHCLTRTSQLNLEGVGCSGGVYAPTIRFHEGLFYMCTTLIGPHGGNFFVTAKDPAGPWSEPVRVERDGIDPTIFFDDDGMVYFITDKQMLSTIDLSTGAVTSPVRQVWEGTGGSYPEAPHLYKVNGWYYLLIAEGGTNFGHRVTVARSGSIWGPYESCPHNPILCHSDKADSPIQCTGHGDLIQAHDGSWWMVFLATRPWGNVAHLGRETFLAPVAWDGQGWPVVNGGNPVTLEMSAPPLPPAAVPAQIARDDFDAGEFADEWTFIRNPVEKNYSLGERPGWLRLRGSAESLSTLKSPTFVGRRQQHFDCVVSTRMEFSPAGDNEEAGLAVVMNHTHYCQLGVTLRNGKKVVFARRCLDSLNVVVRQIPLQEGAVELAIFATAERYEFKCRQDGGEWVMLDTPETRYVSAEVARTFTGVLFGLYSTGNGSACAAEADFDWFEYQPQVKL